MKQKNINLLENRAINARNIFGVAAITPITMVINFLVDYLKKTQQYILFEHLIIIGLLCLGLCFLLGIGMVKNTFDHEGALHIYRFVHAYLIGIIASLVFMELPLTGWMFTMFFLIFSLLTDAFTGLMAGVTLLVFTMNLTQIIDFRMFLVYFISGVMGIVLFQGLSDYESIARPIAITLGTEYMLLMLYQLISNNRRMVIEDTIVPTSNILINLLVIILFLRYYNLHIVKELENRYQTINDPEYETMLQIRENSHAEYYRCLHTAYLVERICNTLNLDVRAAKTAAYYFRLPEQNLLEMNIPEHGLVIIHQLKNQKKCILEKEAVVVLICDTVISTIQYIKEHSVSNVEYETILNKLYEKKITPESFLESEITLREMHLIRARLLEEKMYYDFIH